MTRTGNGREDGPGLFSAASGTFGSSSSGTFGSSSSGTSGSSTSPWGRKQRQRVMQHEDTERWRAQRRADETHLSYGLQLSENRVFVLLGQRPRQHVVDLLQKQGALSEQQAASCGSKGEGWGGRGTYPLILDGVLGFVHNPFHFFNGHHLKEAHESAHVTGVGSSGRSR